MTFDQAEFELRCEWGLEGVRRLAPISDVIVIVDVLSFSTAVDIAVSNGAIVFPYPARDSDAEEYARSKQAQLAEPLRTSSSGFSLSPQSLLRIPAGYRLVLPSPNGGALPLATGEKPTVAGCLRNAAAVGRAAKRRGATFAVIPAGEQWEGGGLRPCVEDLIGVGAVLSQLPGRASPEAEAAIAAFERARYDLPRVLAGCASGKELIERGFAGDVELAAEFGVSAAVPWLVGGAFVRE